MDIFNFKRFDVINIVDAPEIFYGAGRVAPMGIKFLGNDKTPFFGSKCLITTIGVWDKEDFLQHIKSIGFLLPS